MKQKEIDPTLSSPLRLDEGSGEDEKLTIKKKFNYC